MMSAYILISLGVVGICLAAPVEKVDQQRPDIERVGRGFGDQVPNLLDPHADRMVDWRSVYHKRSPVDFDKRQFGGEGHNSRSLSVNFQDWSSTFGRNYRSFGKQIPRFGEHAGLTPLDLQNWSNFIGHYTKRLAVKRGLGNSQSPRFGTDLRPSDLQNWSAFFSRAGRPDRR